MRIVLDTNVLVSALLHPGRTPDLALGAARAAGAVILVDARVEAEYREVLGRSKFRAVDPARRDALVAEVLASSERVAAGRPTDFPMLDPDDRAFVEVALAGRADAVVTGNGRHYPEGMGFAVLSPAALLVRLKGG
jgi:putative PIN family toxin of toxin-antitoxin system